MALRVITLTDSEMLTLWKLRSLLEPLGTGAETVCADGIDIDTLLRRRIDDWYYTCLATAPVDSLPLTELSATLTARRTTDGAGAVSLPEGLLRVASVELEGWERPATVTDDPQSALALAQSNPYSRGRCSVPVAVAFTRSSTLLLYTPPEGEIRIRSLKAVMRPPEGTYTLTDRMLATMPCDPSATGL